MKGNKGQAAMEYLMTYGWAILVVVAVVAALYGLGVFKGGTGSSVKCSPCFSYFAYVDYSSGTLQLTNGPNQIVINNVTNLTGSMMNTTLPSGTIAPGATVTFNTVTQSGNQALTINYTVSSSSLIHTDTATIHN